MRCACLYECRSYLYFGCEPGDGLLHEAKAACRKRSARRSLVTCFTIYQGASNISRQLILCPNAFVTTSKVSLRGWESLLSFMCLQASSLSKGIDDNFGPSSIEFTDSGLSIQIKHTTLLLELSLHMLCNASSCLCGYDYIVSPTISSKNVFGMLE